MGEIKVTKLHEFTGHTQPVYALSVDPVNRRIYSGAADGMVIRWQLDPDAPGEVLMRLPQACFTLLVDNSDTLWVAENQFGIRKLNLSTNRLEYSVDLGRHFYFDIQVVQNKITVGDNAGNLVIGNHDDETSWRKFRVGTSSIRKIACDSSTGKVALGMSDNTVRIGSVYPTPIFDQQFQAHSRSVFALAYLKTRPFLLSGGKDAQICTWAVNQGYALAGTIPAHLYGVNFLDVRSDDRYFLSASMDKTIKLWDTFQGELLKVIDFGRYQGHRTSINKVLWISNNEFISCGDDRKVCWWKIEGLS